MSCMPNPIIANPMDAYPKNNTIKFKIGVAIVAIISTIFRKIYFSQATDTEDNTLTGKEIAVLTVIITINIFNRCISFTVSPVPKNSPVPFVNKKPTIQTIIAIIP